MKVDVKFSEQVGSFRARFGSVQTVSDGGFESGFDEGYNIGSAEGYEKGKLYGIEIGKKSEYDVFWNIITANWERANYSYAFSFWSKFVKPPKIITPQRAIAIFENSSITELPDDCNIDFSNSTFLQAAFQYCRNLTYVSSIDCSSCTGANIMFLCCEKLRKVTLINIRPECTWQSAFAACYKLEELMVSGTIGTEFGMNSQKLVKSSIVSIINALSATAAGMTVSLSRVAVNNAFETSSGVADGSTSEEWLSLINTKPNWTISLA